MNYHVLARKWRPQTFADLVGQTHVVKALTYALSNQKIHHAYLFTGTRGVGKTSIARIFAKSLNCEEGISATPCDKCETCIEIKSGKFVDLIEVDAASRTGVEETRDLIESVPYLPSKGRYKVYLIDEVHMFSKSSFNALLKTLEEPPEHVKFILATTDPEKLPITILSRCLQFNLKALTSVQICQHLANICKAESIPYDKAALELLASAGDGSVRDTLSMTDQAIAYGHGELRIAAVTEILGTIHPADIEAILFSIATNNPNQLSQALHRLDSYEVDARAFLIEIMRRLQRMAWAKEGIVDQLSPALQSTVSDIPKSLLHLWYDIAEKALPNLAIAGEPRQAVEMALLRMLAFIPDDWITRHRTLLESNADILSTPVPPQIVEPKVNFAHEVQATAVTEHDSLASAEADFSGDYSPVASNEGAQSEAIAEIKPIVEANDPVTEIAPNIEVQIENPHSEANECAQSEAIAGIKPIVEANDFVTEKASNIEAQIESPHSEANVHEMTASESNSTQVSMQLPSQPSMPEQQLDNGEQATWHLSADEQSNEPPPSMDDIHAIMQRGRDIDAPVISIETERQENGADAENTSKSVDAETETIATSNDLPPWEESLPPENQVREKISTNATILANINTETQINTQDIGAEMVAEYEEIISPNAPATSVNEPHVIENIPKRPISEETQHTSDVDTIACNTDLSTFKWHEVLPELGLGDYSNNLASLGVLRISQADGYLQTALDLPPKNNVLVTEDSLQEIKQALENHFITPIDFAINLTVLDESTPSERNKLAKEQKQVSLHDTFRQEPITQAILSGLNGTVLEKTIKFNQN